MNLNGDTVPQPQALSMLLEEVKLRKTDKIQSLYDTYNQTEGGYVEELVQNTILTKFGYTPSPENLEEYRHMIWRFRQVPEVRDQIFFMKYNIMRDGHLKIGDPAPDVPLLQLDKTPCTLHGLMSLDKPLIILAGSLT